MTTIRTEPWRGSERLWARRGTQRIRARPPRVGRQGDKEKGRQGETARRLCRRVFSLSPWPLVFLSASRRTQIARALLAVNGDCVLEFFCGFISRISVG